MEHAREDAGSPDIDLDASDPRVVELLGEGHAAVSAFGEALAAEGVLRGLIGPREIPRLWGRHLLNSAAVAALLPESGTLVDVGSGAGLPGVVLAAMRPDLRVVLLEPMERRVSWLEHVTALIGLENVEVLRGRAEDVAGSLRADVVTARAVAPMERLAGWTLPLLVQGGVLLALKGRHAAEELSTAAAELARYGGDAGEVLSVPTVVGVDSATIVRVVRTAIRGDESATPRGGGSKAAPARAGGSRRAGKAKRGPGKQGR